MRLALTILILLVLQPTLSFAETIGVPWSEFKELYGEHIKNTLNKGKKVEVASRYTIDEGQYELKVNEQLATCKLVLKGRVLTGAPGPIPLLPSSTILSGVAKVSGGSLVFAEREGNYIGLLPQKGTAFSLELSFLLTVEEDKVSKIVTLPP